MKLEVSSGSNRFEIEIASPPGSRRVRIADQEADCDWVRLPDGSYSLILDGRVYDVSVSLDTDTCTVAGRAGHHQLRIYDPRRLSGRTRPEHSQAGLRRVCAEMPGKVVRLLVKQGDKVSYDQGLLVLEAMKMQNEIRAPKNGVVSEIGVRDNSAVNTGDFLLSIE